MQRLDVPYLLTLSLVPKVCKTTLHRILKKLQSKPKDLKELCEVVQPIIKVSQEQLKSAYDNTQRILKEHESAGITVIGIDDPKFPQQLKTISNPPLILYVKGNIDCLKPQRSVAVIGTRQPTNYGRTIGSRIAQRFAEQGLIVVSGLAQGCDTAGHQGCLKAKGHTVAVLAHGLDRVYPSQNRQLAQEILDNDGCLVSEYPIGNKPFKNQFVERDRIQSGLSSAVVIVETDIKGGTMHTARFCLEQNRILACIDHDSKYRSEKSRGNEKLITEGKAKRLKNSDDFKNLINDVFGESIVIDSNVIELSESETSLFKTESNTIKDTEIQADNINASQNKPEALTIEVQLSKKEKERFEAKCAANGMNTNQVLYQFITDYSNNNLEKTNASKSNISCKKELKSTGINQLALPIIKEKSDNSENKNFALKRKELAQRLKVSPSSISINKKKGSEFFKNWSREKDPEKHSWEYSEKKKLFEIAF